MYKTFTHRLASVQKQHVLNCVSNNIKKVKLSSSYDTENGLPVSKEAIQNNSDTLAVKREHCEKKMLNYVFKHGNEGMKRHLIEL